MNEVLSAIIPLAPVTKKNHSRIVRCGKYFKLLPSKAYEQYEKDIKPFMLELGRKVNTIDFPVNLKCLFYVNVRRKSDLVGYLQAIQDLLTEYGIISDDNRNIIASVDGSEVLYDKKCPRTEITVTHKDGYEQW